jgi:hypothetical protein
MSSGYGERGGYGQQPGGYPQQGYGAPPAAAAPRPQGHAAAPQKSGPSSALIWVLLIITALNLLLTAYMAWQVYSAVSAFSEYATQLSNLTVPGGSLGG